MTINWSNLLNAGLCLWGETGAPIPSKNFNVAPNI